MRRYELPPECGAAMDGTAVLVTGDRHWADGRAIEQCLRFVEAHYPAPWTLHHGDCRGADTLAARAAASRRWQVVAHPADWAADGRAAGPRRNQSMLDAAQPRVVLAVHANLAASKGTADCVARVKAYAARHPQQGVDLLTFPPTRRVTHKEWPSVSTLCRPRLQYLGAPTIAVDKAGTQAVFGPIVVAAVQLPPSCPPALDLARLARWKTASREERDALETVIRRAAVRVGMWEMWPRDIRAAGGARAAHVIGVRRAVSAMDVPADDRDVVVVMEGGVNVMDGTPVPWATKSILHGDMTLADVAAAALLAKQQQVRRVDAAVAAFPALTSYDLLHNHGYLTPKHRAALAAHGNTPLHRDFV